MRFSGINEERDTGSQKAPEVAVVPSSIEDDVAGALKRQ
jgi:hypothetical protein